MQLKAFILKVLKVIIMIYKGGLCSMLHLFLHI